MGESFIAEQSVYASRDVSDPDVQDVIVDVVHDADGQVQIGFSVGRKQVYLKFRESDYRRAVKEFRGKFRGI